MTIAMAAWGDVGLVLAGSAGPIVVALVTIRSGRQAEQSRWQRDDVARTHHCYATFLAACTQIIADWGDYARLPPRTEEEERELDERRDLHFAELNSQSAMVRLTAPKPVVAAAEEVLAVVRRARATALDLAATHGRGTVGGDFAPIEADFAEVRQHFVDAARAADGRRPGP